MKGNQDQRHLARKVALATAYCMQQQNSDLQSCISISTENLGLDSDEWDEKLANTILEGVFSQKKEIDQIIQENAPQWPLDKIFKIDLVIMQMAVFELLFNTDEETKAPPKVIIDEAIELAKEFGNETSSKFVNGVLGRILEVKNLGDQKENVSEENTKDNI